MVADPGVPGVGDRRALVLEEQRRGPVGVDGLAGLRREIGRRLGWDIEMRRLGDVQKAMPQQLPPPASGTSASEPPEEQSASAT